MPKIDLSMLNQRQTPAFYADVLANRPAAGFIGRIFVSTNTYAFYRDNGTGWDLIGGPGTGTVTGSGTAGQVTYWDGASSITGSNNLFWDSAAGHLGINNNTPGTGLDVHDSQSTILQLNQTTATNDTRIAFQNAGTSLWRIGNFYNAGANDWGIYDVVGAAQRLTVKKTTGQVLIGTSTVGSGKLVVASASSDNGIQIVGATAPSLRIDSAETGATKRIGIGLATAVNNFIQNSQNLDMCIFNGSTSAAGNMLFGIYDTGLTNVQEAARISAARNFLIGTITDAGQKLQVSGTSIFSNTITNSLAGNSSIGLYFTTNQPSAINWYDTDDVEQYSIGIIANSGNGYWGLWSSTSGTAIDRATATPKLVVKNSGNVGIGTTSPSSNLSVRNEGSSGISIIDVRGGVSGAGVIQISGNGTTLGTTSFDLIQNSAGALIIQRDNNPLSFYTNATERMQINSAGVIIIKGTSTTAFLGGVIENTNTQLNIFSTEGAGTTKDIKLQVGGSAGAQRVNIKANGNVLIGTDTDGGQKLQVNGTSIFSGTATFTGSVVTGGGTRQAIISVGAQDNGTVDLSVLMPTVNFNGNFVSLTLQILGTDGGSVNSSIINCSRNGGTTWTYSLVNSNGFANVITLTFGGTSAAPTLAITGTSFSLYSVTYSVLVR